MLINENNIKFENEGHVNFVEYTGKYPNFCSGRLTLEIDGKNYTFSCLRYFDKSDFEDFWTSGGECSFTNSGQDCNVNSSEWRIDVNDIPDEFKKYAKEIDEVFNSNVRSGCCGGCI